MPAEQGAVGSAGGRRLSIDVWWECDLVYVLGMTWLLKGSNSIFPLDICVTSVRRQALLEDTWCYPMTTSLCCRHARAGRPVHYVLLKYRTPSMGHPAFYVVGRPLVSCATLSL